MWNRDQVPFLILTEVTAMGMGIHLENGSGSILDSDRGDGKGNGYSREERIRFHS